MKKRILISYNFILHYREDFFELLNEFYDVTVLHSGKLPNDAKHSYKVIKTNTMKAGPFFLQSGLFNTYFKKKFDVVILLFDLRWPNILVFILFSFIFRLKCKVISWGAWKTNRSFLNSIRCLFMRIADANIFYCEDAKSDFIALGLPEHKAFVANNTFKVEIDVPCYLHRDKDIILFVGSLDARKRNIDLLQGFAAVVNQIPDKIRLVFIGDGSERALLEKKAERLNISSKVLFSGRMNSQDDLIEFYNRALCAVSYGQAGLSVLQSMGFGVPFLTLKGAISGGEISNIKHGHNGILLEQGLASLRRELIKISNDENYARKLGENAYDHYQKHCKLEHMVQGFVEAIENKNKVSLASE